MRKKTEYTERVIYTPKYILQHYYQVYITITLPRIPVNRLSPLNQV